MKHSCILTFLRATAVYSTLALGSLAAAPSYAQAPPPSAADQPSESAQADPKPADSKQADEKDAEKKETQTKETDKKPAGRKQADAKKDAQKSDSQPDVQPGDGQSPAPGQPAAAPGESAASSAAAADEVPAPAEPIVATEPPGDDPDYKLLGEFVGEIETDSGRETLGLQVRPIGGDRFEARQYTGGLPGQEGFGSQSQPLLGQRSGDFLILSGGPWAIFVERERCLVVDRQGKRLGTLERIERTSPTMGAKPPEGATVLFDGSSLEHFTIGEMSDTGLLLPGADVKPMFQDFNLHVEFRLPYMPSFEGQSRGNSGCYLQSRYEVQVLDSFSEAPTFNGCSSLYRQRAPAVNMCLPPLVWQTYDIAFTAPRWAADGTKLRNARITVWQNGVKTQDDVEIEAKTGAGKPEEPTLLPIRFQNHKDPVRFRNIWIIDRGLTPVSEFPVRQAS